MKSPNDPEPLYRHIRRSLRESIANGTLGPGDRLPSESELARMFSTTRTTVRQALAQMVFEGVIVRHNGRGSFVSAASVIHSAIDSRLCLTFEEQVALTGRKVTYGACSFTLVKAPPEVARLLRMDPAADVFKMERLRIIDKRPVCVELRYLPHVIGLHVTGEMLQNVPVHRFVSDIVGERLPTIIVSITAELAGEHVAAMLNVPVGSALIIRDNTHHASDGTPRLCGRSIFPGDVSTDYVLGQALPDQAGH